MTDLHFLVDSETARVAWTRQAEYHLGLIPQLLRTTIGMAEVLGEPHVPVSRGGSQFDRPQITGGGYYDTVPVMGHAGDGRAAADGPYLWALLADYAESVSEWLGAGTRIPHVCPKTAASAHDAALVIVGTLLKHAPEVWAHRELEVFEGEMFREVRRMQRRYLPDDLGVPQHARTCTVCGSERAVRVRWVDGVAGSPRPRQIGVCRVCGQEYTSEGAGA